MIQVRVRILGLDSVLVLYHGPLFISVPVLAVPFSLGFLGLAHHCANCWWGPLLTPRLFYPQQWSCWSVSGGPGVLHCLSQHNSTQPDFWTVIFACTKYVRVLSMLISNLFICFLILILLRIIIRLLSVYPVVFSFQIPYIRPILLSSEEISLWVDNWVRNELLGLMWVLTIYGFEFLLGTLNLRIIIYPNFFP